MRRIWLTGLTNCCLVLSPKYDITAKRSVEQWLRSCVAYSASALELLGLGSDAYVFQVIEPEVPIVDAVSSAVD